ncbi:MAG: hypothetical protein ACKO2X_09800 [Bacteroidota bacterium]
MGPQRNLRRLRNQRFGEAAKECETSTMRVWLSSSWKADFVTTNCLR